MAKERLTAGETMGLMEELDRYPTGSIYPVTRKGKNGESILMDTQSVFIMIV